jgi:hypothetical protein
VDYNLKWKTFLFDLINTLLSKKRTSLGSQDIQEYIGTNKIQPREGESTSDPRR